MTLVQLIEIYSAEHATEWTTKTASEFKGLFRLLVRIVGDVSISTIDRKTCIELRDILLAIPPKHDIAFKYRGLSIEDLVALDIKKLKPKTINKHLQLYSGMFRWAVRNRYTVVWIPHEGPVVRRAFIGLERIKLRADNPEYPEIFIPTMDLPKGDDIILGKVRWVLQKV